MEIKQIAKTRGGQDGAIFGDYLFRLSANGACRIYRVDTFHKEDGIAMPPEITEIVLDRAGKLVPHSNAVCFGAEYFEEGDEFPLLYSNIYNNYAKAEDPLVGACCVYRVQRSGDKFWTTLVQLIRVGFTDSREHWRSEGQVQDLRPYGNFTVDRQKNLLYAFVMRDQVPSTRFFAFRLPKCSEGKLDDRLGIRCVCLEWEDVIDSFDTPYQNFMQGACCHDGKIYCVEGFHETIHPAIRIIDPAQKKEIFYADFCQEGYPTEAEFIDFNGENCWYCDVAGNVYQLKF